MTEIRIEIEPAVLERFPDCRVGGFLARGLRAATVQPEEPVIEGISLETLTEEPRIREWRKAYQQIGVKPSTYRGSAEQLARRLLKGSWISTPLPMVNLYSAVSVKHLTPMGAYDVERLPEPSVVLRFPREGDVFQPLGGRPEDMPLRSNLVVYASGSEITCWAFNHRDSAKTALHAGTDLGIFMAEAVSPVQYESLDAAFSELARELREAGAEVGEIICADAAQPVAITRLD